MGAFLRPHVLGIDPGDGQSAYALIDSETCRPAEIGIAPNDDLRIMLPALAIGAQAVGVEMIASYGMPVGREVFETCVWIGRFQERLFEADMGVELIYRREAKLHHCGSVKATDSNIRRALVDQYAPGVSNYGKGSKATPGWFYGFADDIWAAYAVATLVADRRNGRQGVA